MDKFVIRAGCMFELRALSERNSLTEGLGQVRRLITQGNFVVAKDEKES